MTELYGHPVFGASWEGWCIEQVITRLPLWQPFFYRTSSGEEIDLVLTKGRKRLAFEIKASLTPHLSKGFSDTITALKQGCTWGSLPYDRSELPHTKRCACYRHKRMSERNGCLYMRRVERISNYQRLLYQKKSLLLLPDRRLKC
jgi:hypothetical protein